MNRKRLLAACTAALVLAGSVLPASAAEIDAAYVNALRESGTADLILDVEAYRAAYSDLDAAFGDNTEAYILHYLTAGMYEGRTMGVLFNPLTYAEAYSDIKEAFGDDVSAIVSHYVTMGVTENRTAGTACGYADIAEAERNGVQSGNTANRSATVYSSSAATGSNTAAGSGGNVATGNGNTAGSGTGSSNATVNSTAAGNNSGSASTGNTNDCTTKIREKDNKGNEILIRVEYYDSSSKTHMVQYSDVTNYDVATNSYTEYIYSCDTNALLRTDTYVNGVCVSSVPN